MAHEGNVAEAAVRPSGAGTPGPAASGRLSRRLVRVAARAGSGYAGPSEGGGSLRITEPGRRDLVVGTGSPEVGVTVVDPRAFAAVAFHGSTGLGRSYVDGWWESDDLVGVVQVLVRRTAGYRRRLDRLGGRAAGALSLLGRLRPPSKEEDRANIRAHYDLSNELFDLMLDPTMAYSSAVFEHPGQSLERAQVAKFDRLCRKLALGPSDHVVEIGTGWGGFTVHAAAGYGCRVTTTTISEAQRERAVKRVADAGLVDRVTVLDADYRDLTGTYDALVSVEMVEAVDWRRHDEFFAVCDRLLRPDGRMALQAITMADGSYERAKHHDDFIRSMIFPGGCIPSVAAIAGSVARATELRIVDLEDIGRHYAETLARWRANVEEHREEIGALGFDDRFLRLWTFYLAYCEAAFLERHISDVQVVLARPGWRPPLATRPC